MSESASRVEISEDDAVPWTVTVDSFLAEIARISGTRSDCATPDLAPGAVIAGRDRLDEVLGRGAYGTVWAAHDALAQDDVAVKLLTATSAEDAAGVRAEVVSLRELGIAGEDHRPEHRRHLEGVTVAPSRIEEPGTSVPDHGQKIDGIEERGPWQGRRRLHRAARGGPAGGVNSDGHLGRQGRADLAGGNWRIEPYVPSLLDITLEVRIGGTNMALAGASIFYAWRVHKGLEMKEIAPGTAALMDASVTMATIPREVADRTRIQVFDLAGES